MLLFGAAADPSHLVTSHFARALPSRATLVLCWLCHVALRSRSVRKVVRCLPPTWPLGRRWWTPAINNRWIHGVTITEWTVEANRGGPKRAKPAPTSGTHAKIVYDICLFIRWYHMQSMTSGRHAKFKYYMCNFLSSLDDYKYMHIVQWITNTRLQEPCAML
jgi:hypothetical protein